MSEHTTENGAPEEVVYGAVARAMALAADDPDWMNVTRWPRVFPPAECPACYGSGEEHYDGGFRTTTCRTCKGSGRVIPPESSAR